MLLSTHTKQMTDPVPQPSTADNEISVLREEVRQLKAELRGAMDRIKDLEGAQFAATLHTVVSEAGMGEGEGEGAGVEARRGPPGVEVDERLDGVVTQDVAEWFTK
ncbi:hypothetical protein KIPB_016226 [Kipferlia bialata]|uniref:Uncharacterized protein n=1 Tax=Kipferlia bialata TaxID=797122 RepID=A0A391NVB8_9EUKA|nr:hypothetical protein KIPB_016226 [Kipferlia bialata]|eukprot:g16226.t1